MFRTKTTVTEIGLHPDSSNKEDASAKKAQANTEKIRQAIERAQAMGRRFEGASREQREQMIREYRGRGGRGRGRPLAHF